MIVVDCETCGQEFEVEVVEYNGAEHWGFNQCRECFNKSVEGE